MSTVVVRNGNVDGALRTMKQKNAKEGLLKTVKEEKLKKKELKIVVEEKECITRAVMGSFFRREIKMKERILVDLKNAMKNQNKDLLNVVRMVKGAIQLEEIKVKHVLNDDEVITIIAREIKTRKESNKEFEKGGRTNICLSN